MEKTNTDRRRGPKGPQPQKWLYKDPFDHVRHNAWLKHRSQARYRNEPYELECQDFFTLWPTEEMWARRGKLPDSLCMVRADTTLPWSLSNTLVVERYAQLVRDKTAHRPLTRTLERTHAYSKTGKGGHSPPTRNFGRKPRDQGTKITES